MIRDFAGRGFALAFTAILLTSQLTLGRATAADWRTTAFPVQKHDFGTVAVAADTEFFFPVVNTFQSPIEFAGIRTSCGCTTATVLNPTIQPGQTGYIKAKFNTGTFRGKKGATLTLTMKRPFRTEVRLRVDGYIRSDMVFHPGSVKFGSVNSGEAAEKITKVLYAGRSNWMIREVTSRQPWMIPTLTETKRNGGNIEYQLAVKLTEDAPKGPFQDELVVVTNDTNMPRVPLRVAGKVESALEVSPSTLAAGGVTAGSMVTKRLTLLAKQDVLVDAVESDDWKIEFQPGTKAKRNHFLSLKMTYAGDAIGSVRSPVRIRVRTPEGGQSETSITVVADIRAANIVSKD